MTTENGMLSLDKYPTLKEYTSPVKSAEREIVGREDQIETMLAAFCRPELCNVLLLGEAGSGKTATVQGCMKLDSARIYLEVDLSRMLANLPDSNEMAARLKKLFDETIACVNAENKEIVLFMDEFHQIVQLSAAAVEALKPMLADSGTRGVRVIAATTYDEFRQYISPNQALVERLQRVNIPEADKDLTVEILRGMARRYDVEYYFENDAMFELIFEYTNRYIPANAQPRKSILMLDAMVGWHRLTGRPMDRAMLAEILKRQEGVNVSFSVDALGIKREIDKYVLSQDFATTVIERRLQICVADLNDKTRPMASMLFTGSSGVGKTEVAKQLSRILFGDMRNLIRIDCTEFANSDSLERFRDEITSRVWARPFSILLLDEIEKACSPVTRLLLQVLDDGRLSDKNGRETSFINTYIIMTTNAASEIYKTIAQYQSDDSGSGEAMKSYERIIRRSISETTGSNRFPPELLGRIDCIVPFQPLSLETQRNIVKMRLTALAVEVKQKYGIIVKYDTNRLLDYIVLDNLSTDSDAGGARIIMSKIEDEVTTNIARFINGNKDVNMIGVYVHGDIAAYNKTQLKSNAYIDVAKIS